jgi:Trehalase
VSALRDRAAAVLAGNDRGGYTVPTARLYPFQWNWDSGLVALGWATFDEARAWQELERLFEGQWPDGMLPHIVFHQESADYFPGPAVWGVDHAPPTSGLTQPPVHATVVRLLVESAREPALADTRARALYPRLLALHRWWREARDARGTGLVAIHHPWESGRDNSPVWDEALARVPPTTSRDYQRRDTGHVDPVQRPRQAEYDRYLYLVELFRAQRYAPEALAALSPFRMADVGVNAILQRASLDLAALARRYGSRAEVAELVERADRTREAFTGLWDAGARAYRSLDLISGRLVGCPSSADFLPLYAHIPDAAVAADLAATLDRLGQGGAYLVPSVPPDHPTFERRRYWRGPVWAIVNWMIADGLRAYGHDVLAERIRRDTRRLVEGAGFSEYFDPLDGAGYGGGDFSWTAAMALHWALPAEGPARSERQAARGDPDDA